MEYDYSVLDYLEPAIISGVARNLVIFGLLIALVLFIRLALKAKTIRSFQSELSIFVIIWVLSELVRALLVLRIIEANPTLQLLSIVIHTISMVAFGVFIVVRFYRHRAG